MDDLHGVYDEANSF